MRITVLVQRQRNLGASGTAEVGRVIPCAPRAETGLPNGAHGVTRPTVSPNVIVTALLPAIVLFTAFVGSANAGSQTPGSDKPVAAAAAIAPAVSRYTLAVRVDPALHQFTATARVEVTGADTAQPLTFLLNKQLTVASVCEAGRSVSFSHGTPMREAKPLRVELPRSATMQSVRELVIEYDGTIPPPGPEDPDWMGALVIRGNEVRMTEQSKWYPMLNESRTPVEASITLPADFALVWPGPSGKTIDQNGRATWKAVCTNPVAPALIAGIYATSNSPPLSVRLFSESADETEAIRRQAHEILAFLESRFGPRPFEHLSICQMRVLNRRFSYNFAVPGAVVLPTEIIRMARRQDRRDFWTRKLAHEIAHQWWGCSVDLPREPWPLNESLAELSAILYLQSLQPDKPLGHFLADETEALRRISSLARQGEMPSEKEHRTALGYQKGPWVLAMLREMLGSKNFDQALRSFYPGHAFRRATQEDFQQNFGRCGLIPLPNFFEQWIQRPLLPRVTVVGLPSGQSGQTTLRITQAEPAFTLPVEFRVVTATGSTVTSCLLTQVQQEITTQIQGPLHYVEVDPGGKLLLESATDTNALIQTLIRAKTAYEELLVAQRANQTNQLYASARELRDIFREFSTALELERLRARLSDQQLKDARTASRIQDYEQLKQTLGSFFRSAGPPPDLGRLMLEISESADDIHDAIRDQQLEKIAAHATDLAKHWDQLSEHVRACSRIAF